MGLFGWHRLATATVTVVAAVNSPRVWYRVYSTNSYGNKIVYKNLDFTQDFPNKISFHFLWVKMLPKNLPKIFRWPEMCPLDKILTRQGFQMAAFTKILGRRDKSVVPLLSTENCTVYPSPYSCKARWYTIIDISTILVTMYYKWSSCWVIIGGMVINISVQYNGGFLPDIILLPQGYLHRYIRLNTMKKLCICCLE